MSVKVGLLKHEKINFLKLVFIVSNNTVHIIPDKHGAARGGEACALYDTSLNRVRAP